MINLLDPPTNSGRIAPRVIQSEPTLNEIRYYVIKEGKRIDIEKSALDNLARVRSLLNDDLQKGINERQQLDVDRLIKLWFEASIELAWISKQLVTIDPDYLLIVFMNKILGPYWRSNLISEATATRLQNAVLIVENNLEKSDIEIRVAKACLAQIGSNDFTLILWKD